MFYFFCLNFVIKGVPGGPVRQGGIPGCPEGVLGMFRRCSEPVPRFTDTQACVKIILIVSCLEWLICLVLFIMMEFKSYYTAPTHGTHFSCYESLSKGYNVQMSLCFTLT